MQVRDLGVRWNDMTSGSTHVPPELMLSNAAQKELSTR
jgi:hypothetical protein